MRRALYLLLLLAVSPGIWAHEEDSSFFHLTMKDGLPSNHIYCSLVDARGFFWMTTRSGVARYNGYTVRSFTVKDGLPTNDIIAVRTDSHGNIWLFSLLNDIGFIADDAYHSIFGDRRPAHNLNVRDVREIGGDLYFESEVPVGVSAYKYEPGTRTTHEFVYRDPKAGTFNTYNLLFEKADKDTVDYYRVSMASGVFRMKFLYRQPEYHKVDFSKEFFYYDRDGHWVTVRVGKDKIYMVVPEKRLSRTLEHHPLHHVFERFYNTEHSSRPEVTGQPKNVSALTVYTSDSVYLLNDELQLLRRLHNPFGEKTTQFIQYTPGGFFGTVTNGAYFFKPFLLRRHMAPIPASSIVSWNNDYGGTALLKNTFTRNIGIGEIGITRSYLPGTVPLIVGSADVRHVTQGRLAGSFWKKFNGVSLPADWGRAYWKSPVRNREKALSSFRFTSFLPVYGDSIFFFTASTGLYKAIAKGDTAQVYSLNPNRFSYTCYDSNSHLLIAYTDNLVFVYNTVNGRKFELPTNRLKQSGINSIDRIYFLDHDRLMVKSHNDLAVYSIIQRRFIRVKHCFNVEQTLGEVIGDHFYLSGRFGIAAIPVDSLENGGRWRTIPNFKGSYYTQVYDVVHLDTAILLGTENGVFSVSRQALLQSPFTDATPYFNLFIKGQHMYPVREGDTLVVGRKEEKLKFDANNFYGAGSLSISYRGGNGSNISGTNTDLYLPDLAPEVYFPVTLYARDDAWANQPVTFYLYRRPYWYQMQAWTRIFWIGGALLFFIFVGAVILLTRSVVQRSNEKRRQLIELELRALYAQINPHFIFNSLNSAQYFINARHIDKAYDHVNKFARLLRAYLKSSHDRYITVAEEVNMLHYYIELQQERFREPFEYNIRVDNKIPAANVQIPSLLLQPLVENAINHGLFHKKEKGHLNIEFMQGTSNDELICIIEDDGVGRERAREIGRADKGSRFGSYGTRLTEQLINIFERYEQMNIQVSYQDKTYPNTGTIVTLTVRNVKYIA